MASSRPNSRAGALFRTVSFGFLALFACALGAQGQTRNKPAIAFVQVQGNVLLIHFYADANRVYELQTSTLLASKHPGAVQWTNIFSAPAIPFTNHYIVSDTMTNKLRLYRLLAIP